MISNDIENARARIIEMFLDQCVHGEQTAALNDAASAACGQFIGTGARSLTQRGLHGTAAAIRVLANAPITNTDAQSVLARLLFYLNHCTIVEQNARDGLSTEHLQNDWDNTIKISEILHSLSFVSASLVGVNELKLRIVELLRNSLINGKGWPYFCSEKRELSLLPTAYAVLALAAHNENVSQPVEYLLSSLESANSSHVGEPVVGVDVTTRVACLYALAFGGSQLSADTQARLTALFRSIWKQLRDILRSGDIEQNVEYWRGSRTFYVRIPWQLYMLALAARLGYPLTLGTFAVQVRLRSLLAALKGAGFKYPHSGHLISSRTTAISFEVIGHIHEQISRGERILPVIETVDQIRSSSIILWAVRVAATALAGWAVLNWWTNPDATWSDIAPDLVASAVAFLALWSRGGGR